MSKWNAIALCGMFFAFALAISAASFADALSAWAPQAECRE